MKILVLPGDGIGPEIMLATLGVLRAADSLLDLNLGAMRDAVPDPEAAPGLSDCRATS